MLNPIFHRRRGPGGHPHPAQCLREGRHGGRHGAQARWAAEGDRSGPWGADGGPGGFGRHGGGHGGGHGGHGGRHGGGPGRGGRMFESGAIKLLALSLVAERPCHGYDLIKFIEGLVGGDYSPSPGVIYPTLTYLVDMGWATVQDGDGGRKQYLITPDGQAQLARQQDELQRLLARLQQVRIGAGARRSPDIERAMGNLKAVLQVRFAQSPSADPELGRRVAALIDEAALAIQKL